MRRGLLVLLAVLIALGIAHFAYWRYAQRELAAGYARWVVDAGRHGWQLTARAVPDGGWPTEARLRLSDARLSGSAGTPVREVAWAIPQVDLRIALTAPGRIGLVFAGQQRLRVGTGPELAIAAERLEASIGTGADTAATALDLTATGLAVSATGPPGSAVRLGTLQAHGELAAPAGPLVFTVEARDINLPAGRKWPLGPHVASFAVDGTASGDLAQGATPAAWANAWRDSGGSVELRRLDFEWGPLGVAAAATLALDDQLQPMGTGSARLVGYPAALDALARTGTLSRSAATAAKAVLSLLATSPGGGEQDQVDVPLTLQYRTLSIRQIPLIRVPEVDWERP